MEKTRKLFINNYSYINIYNLIHEFLGDYLGEILKIFIK